MPTRPEPEGAVGVPGAGPPTSRAVHGRSVPRVRAVLAVLAAFGAGTAAVQAATAGSAYDGWAAPPPDGGLVLQLPGQARHGPTLELPDDALDALLPGEVRTVTLTVTNGARTPQVVSPEHTWLGPDGSPGSAGGFDDPPSVDVAGLPDVLEPGSSAVVTVRVATPSTWAQDNAGRTARLVVRFLGTHV